LLDGEPKLQRGGIDNDDDPQSRSLSR